MKALLLALRSNLKSILAILAISSSTFVAGRYTTPVKDVALVDVPAKVIAKKGKLNVVTVNSTVPIKFFTEMTDFRVCGKDFIFSGDRPFKLWVLFKDASGELADPLLVDVTMDDMPPVPVPPVPVPPVPVPPAPPTDPIAKAVQTAWQQEFMPNKATYLPKIQQLYQAMLTSADTAITYGDVSKVMTDKSKELSLTGVCPTLSAAINTELGKVFPRSPSVLIDKQLAKDTLSTVLTAITQLR